MRIINQTAKKAGRVLSLTGHVIFKKYAAISISGDIV
jgi:hypothetical protein